MKKKIYKSPVAEFVNIAIDVVLENTSPWTEEEDGSGFWTEQDANENVGSWSDIWRDM